MLDAQGHMTPTEVERDCEVDIAVRWDNGYDTTVRSFVNIIATPKGGTHVAGFEAALLKTFKRQVEAQRPPAEGQRQGRPAGQGGRPRRPDGHRDRAAGRAAVRGPDQGGAGHQRRARHRREGRRRPSSPALLTSTKRGEKQQAALLLEKVVAEMKSRVSARQHKETQRRKNALESSSLPAKLADCRTDDVERSELFIVEGDSALGTAKLARSSEHQALLPIRGKILNVQKASIADMLRNAECASIIQVIGAGSGRTFDVDAARYGKVILMTDADVDGAHIRTLLLTLFFRYMRPLVEQHRVFAAVPPLHRLEVVSPKKGQDRYLYTYSEAELRKVQADLERKGQRWKEPLQRYKGLGEMDADQLAETTMDPRRRTLRRVTLGDAERAERVFDLLMGSDVAPRKDFIVAGAGGLDRERIDA